MATLICISSFVHAQIKKLPIEIILAFLWLSFEIMHLFWSLSWPWMNLGNVFANKVAWIQWYEMVGVYGGSFWIILVNGLLYRTLKTILGKEFKTAMILSILSLLLIFIPILLSHTLIKNKLKENQKLSITIIQPNIDTYIEKFDKLSPTEQSHLIINQLDHSPLSKLIILPETVIPKTFNSQKSPYPQSIQLLLNWSKRNQKQLIGGFNTKDSLGFYNSALYIEEGIIQQKRNKIKLLPFGESMPFEWIYKVFKNQIARDGGNSFGYKKDKNATVFSINSHDSINLGTLICFESAFPDINSEMVRNGAHGLVVITNDDWWKDTPGHRQHFDYARIRAIENRRFIIRSANTGISGFIDEYGRIIKQTSYQEHRSLTHQVTLIYELTFFTKYEAVMRWFYPLIALLMIAFSLLLFSSTKKQRKQALNI